MATTPGAEASDPTSRPVVVHIRPPSSSSRGDDASCDVEEKEEEDAAGPGEEKSRSPPLPSPVFSATYHRRHLCTELENIIRATEEMADSDSGPDDSTSSTPYPPGPAATPPHRRPFRRHGRRAPRLTPTAATLGLPPSGGGAADELPDGVDLDDDDDPSSVPRRGDDDSNNPFNASEGQHLDERKGRFIQYIQDQIQKVKIRSNILRFKYSGYKRLFDFFNIGILLLSALMTLMEALRARFSVDVDAMDTPVSITLGVSPIVISSLVTIASALVKFKKYHTKMENLQRAIQKAIFTIFRLKRIQENAKHLRTDEDLETLIQIYSGEPYDMYVQCQEEMEKNLRYEDLVKHMKTYYNLSLSYERSEMEYRLQRLLLDATQQLREGAVDETAADSQRPRSRVCCVKRNNASSCPIHGGGGGSGHADAVPEAGGCGTCCGWWGVDGGLDGGAVGAGGAGGGGALPQPFPDARSE